jgi:hypothetical protein
MMRALASGAGALILSLAACTDAAAPPAVDLGGIWARNTLEFEVPGSGPGPILPMMRNPDGTPAMEKVGDYTNPILLPAAAQKLKALGDIARTGVVFPDPENQCLDWPLPNILRHMQIQILQELDQVTIVYLRSNQVRRVRLNSSHPTELLPSPYGDSVGRYEGDTLVVDTVGIKVGSLPMVDWYGTPYSEALHVVERYRLIDYGAAKDAIERHERKSVFLPPGETGIEPDLTVGRKGLQIEITVEDGNVFAMPWSALVTYRPSANGWMEEICAENLRESIGPERNVPTAKAPDF